MRMPLPDIPLGFLYLAPMLVVGAAFTPLGNRRGGRHLRLAGRGVR